VSDFVGYQRGVTYASGPRKIANASVLVKYANYQGSGTSFGGFPDKSIFWLQLAYKY